MTDAQDRYFFVIEGDGYDHPDKYGTLLPGRGAARSYAERIIRELKEGGYDAPGLAGIVRDTSGNVVLEIPF